MVISMKNVTLRDVAELAGVSQATASLTLNHSSRANFRNGTRERVLVAARQLGYRSPARRKRRTDMADYMLLVMVPTLANPYYVELAQAVEEYAASLGYRVTVCNTFRKPELERFYLDILVERNVRGIIYGFLPGSLRYIERLAEVLPIVLVGEETGELPICSIGLSDVNAGMLLADHLLALGHRQFAFISTPLDKFTLARQQRLEGLRRQMKACGKADEIEVLTTDEKWEVDGLENGQPYEYTIGRRLTADFLATGSSATALIGVNDITALGILQELQEQRRGVPQEFSVCGFDNIFPSGFAGVALTTVEHYMRDKGRCQLCGCDVSGILRTDVKYNIDHIVPLKCGGINDPINLQLSCEHCNKSKGARSTKFNNIASPFWRLDEYEQV